MPDPSSDPPATFVTISQVSESPDAPGRSRLLEAGLAALFFTLLLAQALPAVNGSYLITAALACVAGVLVASTEDAEHRSVSLNLFVWAMLFRCLAVTSCYALGLREGGPFLGPDSSTYYVKSVDLAASAFRIDRHPMLFFGSYDVSHYYLFAAAIRYLHADLFGLQVLNCGLIALAAPLVFGVARIVLPPAALMLGIAVALHPSLIALSAVDLLKDPSIIAATVLLIWVIVRLTRERKPHMLLLYFAAGLLAAVYLRMGRFYSFAYLEIAFVIAATFMLAVRVSMFRRTVALAVVAGILLLAEVLPIPAAWPPSPVMLASSVTHVLGTPAMSQYAVGFFDRLGMAHQFGLAGESGPILAPLHFGPESGSLGALGTIGSILANLFRRLYGPFVWILPADWHFRALQAGDYLLYPGMLVWYGLLPLIAAGLGATAWRIVARTERRFGVVFLWVFTVVYLAQYVTINLSYRQRDVMLPVLLPFAWIGALYLARLTRWRTWYAAYWLALAMIAGGHLLARASFAPQTRGEVGVPGDCRMVGRTDAQSTPGDTLERSSVLASAGDPRQM